MKTLGAVTRWIYLEVTIPIRLVFLVLGFLFETCYAGFDTGRYLYRLMTTPKKQEVRYKR